MATLSEKLIVFELIFFLSAIMLFPVASFEARKDQKVLSSKKMAWTLLNNDNFKEPELINYSNLNVTVPERIKGFIIPAPLLDYVVTSSLVLYVCVSHCHEF